MRDINGYRERFPEAAIRVNSGSEGTVTLEDAIADARCVLSQFPSEAVAVRAAIAEGRILGCCFWDADSQCGCLLGTIAVEVGAIAPHDDVDSLRYFDFLDNLRAGWGSSVRNLRPAEWLVWGIGGGQTPATSQASACALAVVEDWMADHVEDAMEAERTASEKEVGHVAQ